MTGGEAIEATTMRVMHEGEERKREEEREEEQRAMRPWCQQGRNDGIDKPRERGNCAEPEQARRGRCDDDNAGEVEKERRGEVAT